MDLNQDPQILFSDNHLLIVEKPVGMPTQPEHSGAISVYDWAVSLILKQKNRTEGNVFCGIVHRLDRNVGGVLVLARTSKAASRLSAAWREHRVKKEYLALVSPVPSWSESVELVHHLERVERTRRTTVHRESGERTKRAVTIATALKSEKEVSLVHLVPKTGRPHQLRAQMAYEGCPILGDKKYGSSRLDVGLCLFAHALTIPHPTLNQKLKVLVPPPPGWSAEISLFGAVGNRMIVEQFEEE